MDRQTGSQRTADNQADRWVYMDRQLMVTTKLLPFQALPTVAELASWLSFQFSALSLAPGKRQEEQSIYGEFFSFREASGYS